MNPQNTFKKMMAPVTLAALLLTTTGFAYAFATPTMRSAAALAPQPVFFSGAGNIECSDLVGHPSFSHITDAVTETKFDPPTTSSQPVAGNSDMTVSIVMQSATVMSSWSLNWTSPAIIDRYVAAVIIKGGSDGKNVYPYTSLMSGDVGPFIVPGGSQAISHVSFCFEPDDFGTPTSAPATIAGRVVNTSGRGLIGTTLILTNAMTGEIYSTTTNQLGYYLFEGIPSAEFYILSASQRGVTFFENQKTFTLEEDLAGLDFVAAVAPKK